jgi:hypothetical protein
MPQYRAFLQTLGAVVLLALALACHGKSGSSQPAGTANITGNVTYTRVPLAKSPQGVPIGLVDATVPANLQTLPARGVTIRIYQQVTQTLPNGNPAPSPSWVFRQSTSTDSSGNYSAIVTMGYPTMVEMLSTFNGGSIPIRLIAEPQGINSPTPALSRVQYAMRKAADGSVSATSNAPSSMFQANSTVNFTIGLSDPWWIVNPEISLTGDSSAPNVDKAWLETTDASRTPGIGTGSRVLGIGDTIASFQINYGTASPGSTLDLHYWPGQSEPRGSYIEFDQGLFPQSLDTSTGQYHYFGTLSGGPANDDAWDEGVIMPLLARCVLYAGNAGTFLIPRNPLFPQGAALPNLSPDMARIEGLADAMAANLLKSPYLADTQGTLVVPGGVRDIRDVSGLSATQKSPYSAPALRAFAWEIVLKANSLPSPGAATDWANINPLATVRLFLPPSGGGVSATGIVEPINIFSQITRLSEVKSSADPVDLAAVLPDAVIATLGSPFGINWPRLTSAPYASFAANWGTDPVSPFPSVVLSMAKAVQVNGAYPNYSQGEVFYTGFSLNADKRCIISAVISPALGAGAQVDVDFPYMPRTFSFTGTGGSTPVVVIPVATTAPYFHPVRLRMNSPGTLQPDVTVTLTLTPVP